LPKAARLLQSGPGPQLLNGLNISTLRYQRFRFQFSAFLAPSALDQVNDHDDDGNHDQEMDETAADVADEAKKPEHEQDNNYCPKHGVSFDLLNCPLLRHNVVIRSSKRSTSALA
jgi:hypothetical protein